MKKTIFIISVLFSSVFAFSQSEKTKDSPVQLPIKHDTVENTIQRGYDTSKVKFYYEDKDFLKYTNGFVVRYLEINSLHPDKNKLLDVIYYDEKWKLFKKNIFNIVQRQ